MIENNIKQAAEEIFREEGSEAVNKFLRAKGIVEEDIKEYFRSDKPITITEAFEKVYPEEKDKRSWYYKLLNIIK